MPLDFDLIDYSIEYSKNQFLNKTATECPHLFLLSNFLNPLLLKKLLNYIEHNNTDWHTVLYQENTVRKSITLVPDSVVEEVYLTMAGLTESVNSLFQKQSKFSGISIWKDVHPYSIDLHEDNNMIGTALQIYLTSGPSALNTVFEYKSNTINAVYQQNSGYVMDNTYKVPHGMLYIVPKDHVRYSLYAIWADDA